MLAQRVAQAEPGPPRSSAPSQPPRVSLVSSPAASNVVTLRTATTEAVERAALAADEAPFEVPEGFCPKCLARRGAGPSCGQCGLDFAAAASLETEPESWLRESWVALLRAWGDEGAHDALRLRAQREDGLTALGRLYRLRLAAEPDDAIAENGRAEVLRLASVSLLQQPHEAPVGGQRLKLFLAVMLLVLAFAAAAWFVRSLTPGLR